MPKSETALRNEITLNEVAKLEDILTNAGIDFYRTGDNFQTITYEIPGYQDNKPLYISIKLTLHRDGYNLDEEIEEFEYLLAERQQKELDKTIKAENAQRIIEERNKRNEERKAAKERLREKRRKALGKEDL